MRRVTRLDQILVALDIIDDIVFKSMLLLVQTSNPSVSHSGLSSEESSLACWTVAIVLRKLLDDLLP